MSGQYVWTGANSQPLIINDPFNWSNPFNWQSNSIPASDPATNITFAAAPVGASNNNIASPFVLNSLTFNTGLTLSGGQLDFRQTGFAATIVQNTAASVTVTNPLLINAPFFMTGAGFGGMVTLSGPITGGSSFNQGFAPGMTTGSYVTELTSGANTNGGGTFVHAGILRPTVAGALPAGTNVTVTGGTLNLPNGVNHSIGALTLSNGATTGTSPAPQVTGTGTLTLGGNIFYSPNGNGISPAGRIDANINLGGALRTIQLAGISNSFYDLVIGGRISGSGGIAKTGGSLTFLVLTGANTFTGPTIVSAGRLFLGAANSLPSTTAVSLSSGATLSLNPYVSAVITGGNFNQTVGSLAGTGGVVGLGSATLTVGTDNANTTYTGTITGAGGSLVKVGTGTLALSGSNTFSGGLAVNAGTVAVSSDAALGTSTSPVTVGPSGTLASTENASTARTLTLNSRTLAVAAGKTLTFSGATVGGGFLTGTFDTTAVTTRLVGGSATTSTQLTLNGPHEITNYTLGGQTAGAAGATPTFTRVTNTASGRVTVNGTLNTSEFVNNGVRTVPGGATPGRINNTGADVYLGGGSRTYVGANVAGQQNGTINLGGRTMKVNGGLVVNNGNFVSSGTGGIQNGTVNVNYGGLAKGTGYDDAVNVTDGGRFAPGNSITTTTSGSLTLGSGATYQFEINRAGGTAAAAAPPRRSAGICST